MNNRILVTGGSGFLGRHLVRRLLDKYQDAKVRTLSRNETLIVRMMATYPSDRLNPIIGDTRDVEVVKYALKDVDVVIHLAAMKHIDLCESYPLEAITTNVVGTMNLLKLFTGDTFIGMSTDKAVEALSIYGATKLQLERLVLDQARRNTGRRYMIIRSGNFFGSSGSVIEKWKQEIKQSNKITVTDLEMTRFFINVSNVVDFIMKVIEQGENGTIYIPFQKVARLGDLAKAVIDLYGNQETTVEVIGLREREKMHEELFLPAEKNIVSELKSICSEDGERLTIEEIKDWIVSSEEGAH